MGCLECRREIPYDRMFNMLHCKDDRRSTVQGRRDDDSNRMRCYKRMWDTIILSIQQEKRANTLFIIFICLFNYINPFCI